MSTDWPIRLAVAADVPEIEALIPVSVRELHASYHTKAQLDAAIGAVFAVDRQLIHDRTYFVVEAEGQIVGCGGWSKRMTLYGGDRNRPGQDALIDPAVAPARIRAFFVHPGWTRQGIGRQILLASEAALCTAGFRRAELAATLAGEPLYLAMGYSVIERIDAPLSGGLSLPIVRMGKDFALG